VPCTFCKGTGESGIIELDKDKPCFACKGKGTREAFYPRLISKIDWPKELHRNEALVSDAKCGDWVKVRPCDDEYKCKTYLGIMLGDMTISLQASAYPNVDGGDVLEILPHKNSAMYVPDLKKIVWGCGSWWGKINSPDDLREISDADINNIWYVKCLKELGERKDAAQEDIPSPKEMPKELPS
jgi:hypothetical protein